MILQVGALEKVRQLEIRASKSTNGHPPRLYWQKTKITGVHPMDMPGVAVRIVQVHESVLMGRWQARRS